MFLGTAQDVATAMGVRQSKERFPIRRLRTKFARWTPRVAITR